MRFLRPCVLLLSLLLVGMVVPTMTAANAVATEAGAFYPLTSARLLDTRNGTGAPQGALGAGKTLSLQVSGRGGVPTTGVAAVVLNLTVTGASANSYLVAYPTGQTRPGVSSINFVKGITRANSATVQLGTGGKISLYNNSGSVSVIADVVGFYATSAIATTNGTEYSTYGPERLTDTRNDPEGALGGNTILNLAIDFDSGAANSYIKALAVNITAVEPQGHGYLAAFDGGSDVPSTSTLNFRQGVNAANLAVVKTSLCTTCAQPYPVRMAVYNASADPVHVLIDLVGIYYDDGTVGLRFHPMTQPSRISDSRTLLNGRPLTAGQTQELTAPSGVAGVDTSALVSNVTAISPTASTYLTLWEGGTAKPGVSNLNAAAGSTVANGAIIPLSSTTHKFDIYNNAGTTNFVIDVTGRFDAPAGTLSTARVTRTGKFGSVATSSRRQSTLLSR